ncbi:MAG: hypothetical protein JXB00_13220 [Bacteroidales bacterium]|nr:hypothetical protein [Bacteroidales bacterium]
MEYLAVNKAHFVIDLIMHPWKHLHRSSSKKVCPVTGLDISMQPGNSKFLSYSGVKWYYNHRFEIYKNVLEPKLNTSLKDMPPDIKFREIAHAVRNTDSNQRNNARRKITRILEDKNTLFDNYRLIDQSLLKKAGLK